MSASVTGAATVVPVASLARRLGSLLYEVLLLTALVVFLGFALLPLVGARLLAAPGEGSLYVPQLPQRLLSFVSIFVGCGAYCVWLWSGGRRTLPMKTWRLALTRTDGTALNFRVAAIRYLACWIGPACAIAAYAALHPSQHDRWAIAALGINYLWALVDPDRQFLHDRLAGTRILREPPRAS